MVILYIPKPDIPTSLGWTHDATDWQIADDKSFSDDSIVAESKADEDHLTSITFDVDLDTDKTYYSRARVICNKGIFEWSIIDVIYVNDFIKVAFNHDIPSIVMKPKITLISDNQESDKGNDEFVSTMFRIDTTPMSSTSNASHLTTSYIIEDINGNPVYADLEQAEDLNSKYITDILTTNKPYLIKANHRSTSNDVSDIATELVFIKDIKETVLKSNTEDPDTSDGYVVSIKEVDDFSKMYVKLYAVGLGDPVLRFSGDSDETTLVIPSEDIDHENVKRFILGIDVELEDETRLGYKYFVISFS